jgi:hypothetical protein
VAGVILMAIGCTFVNWIGLISFGRVGITAIWLISILIVAILER